MVATARRDLAFDFAGSGGRRSCHRDGIPLHVEFAFFRKFVSTFGTLWFAARHS